MYVRKHHQSFYIFIFPFSILFIRFFRRVFANLPLFRPFPSSLSYAPPYVSLSMNLFPLSILTLHTQSNLFRTYLSTKHTSHYLKHSYFLQTQPKQNKQYATLHNLSYPSFRSLLVTTPTLRHHRF